ncbi:MAG TPA: hypothetical protein VLX32_10515 [Candidatus Acidoferrum sp.]|nr:hypothetical protein [Candidatus Acidoferrum sp.]
MKSHFFTLNLAGLLALAVFSPFIAKAQSPASSSGSATFTVTAVGRGDSAPPPVSKDDLQFSVNKERKQIASWNKGEKLYLAILIDDSLNSQVTLQWPDLKSFIMAQPASTYVALAYASNATVFVAQDFTNDHELVTKGLRIPRGEISAGGSPYLSIEDWIKRWPSMAPDGRASLLLISSGIDYLRAGFGPIYPDVEPVVQLAAKKNINLWSIYYPGAGFRSRSFYLVNTAQLNLSQMCLESGGNSFYMGFMAPVTFKPYLNELETYLNNQYLLTFSGEGGAKGKFVTPKLKSSLTSTDFLYANQVFIPPSK